MPRKLFTVLLFCGPLLHAGPLKQSPGNQLAGVLTGLLVMGSIAVGLTALSLIYAVLRPKKVVDGSQLLEAGPFKTLKVGVGSALSILFFMIVFSKAGPIGDILALLLLLVAASELLRGYVMVVHAIGERVQANIASKTLGSTFFAVLFGSVLVLLCNGVPFLGQLIFVLVLVLSLGISVRQLILGRSKPQAAAPVESPASEAKEE